MSSTAFFDVSRDLEDPKDPPYQHMKRASTSTLSFFDVSFYLQFLQRKVLVELGKQSEVSVSAAHPVCLIRFLNVFCRKKQPSCVVGGTDPFEQLSTQNYFLCAATFAGGGRTPARCFFSVFLGGQFVHATTSAGGGRTPPR